MLVQAKRRYLSDGPRRVCYMEIVLCSVVELGHCHFRGISCHLCSIGISHRFGIACKYWVPSDEDWSITLSFAATASRTNTNRPQQRGWARLTKLINGSYSGFTDINNSHTVYPNDYDFFYCTTITHIAFSELDGSPWSLVQMLMSPSGWIVFTSALP